ncbi:LysR substrate-binding domain-containing protein [Catenulispora yoronensis]|uniref:LysR substrate-binding domain-containing protein n=1 Tax=Catenulispora yoronensis TaxID=450799 RepID=A0ABN2TYB9_9ACTN
MRLLRYFVAVAEERHFGRAAARLHMTQPPLTRAVQRLEADLGAVLLDRTPAGVVLTTAGAALYDEALALLAHADRIPARVAAAAGSGLTVGTLGDSIERVGSAAGSAAGPGSLAVAFRRRHPGVAVRVVEVDFTDPTAGLRAGMVDVAVTRGPFDRTGISTRLIRSEPVGVVLRSDDPLAGRAELRAADLADRRWFRFPEGTDALWSSYWSLGTQEGPVVRTVHECIRAVLWDGIVGLAPFGGAPGPDGHIAGPAEGLTIVPLLDMAPSPLLVAWRSGDANPLLRSFVELAVG